MHQQFPPHDVVLAARVKKSPSGLDLFFYTDANAELAAEQAASLSMLHLSLSLSFFLSQPDDGDHARDATCLPRTALFAGLL